MSTVYSLYTDGGARGNPGPAGAGAVLLDSSGEVVQEVSEYLGEMTNNQAEYRALILGLSMAKQMGVQVLRAFADSELMVRQISGQYKVKHPDIKPLHAEAMTLISQISDFHISHVPREKNAEADKLVNQAIDAHT